MSENLTTNLKQAYAKVRVNGTVSDMDLKVQRDEQGKEYIGGFVTVKTSDVNFVRFNVRVNKLTKEGNNNSTYAGIETVMNEYKSIASHGAEEADKVTVTGDINPFTGRDGNTVIGYKSNFFNRQKANGDYEDKAEFDVELFISAIVPEVVNSEETGSEETGRVLLKGWMPTYNGIEPVTLVGEGEVGEALLDEYEVGQTVRFNGQVVNNRIEHKKEIPMKIGKPRIEITYENKNDLIIEGASEPYEEDGVDKPYDQGAIKLAIQERQNRLEEAKNKDSKPKTGATGTKPSGASRGRTLGF